MTSSRPCNPSEKEVMRGGRRGRKRYHANEDVTNEEGLGHVIGDPPLEPALEGFQEQLMVVEYHFNDGEYLTRVTRDRRRRRRRRKEGGGGIGEGREMRRRRRDMFRYIFDSVIRDDGSLRLRGGLQWVQIFLYGEMNKRKRGEGRVGEGGERRRWKRQGE